MKHRNPTSATRLAAGAAILVLALLALLSAANARPTEANQPDAQITILANPNFGAILSLATTPTPAPFDASAILVAPNLGLQTFVTVPPLLTAPTVIATPQPCGHGITLGKSVNGALIGGGQHCDYTFTGQAGQTVNVTMRRTGGNIDPLIELRGPSSGRIASDDDSDGRLNAALRSYTLDQAGVYTVVARSFDPAASGSFRLNVSAGRPSQPGGVVLASENDILCAEALRYGQAVEGQAPFPGAECRYTFDGIGGDTVALHLKSLDGSPLPEMQVIDPRGRSMIDGETEVSDGALVMSGLQLPATGSYTVVLADTSDTGTGPFELSVLRQYPCKDVLAYDPLRFELSADNPVCTVALLDPVYYLSSITVKPISGDVQPLVQFYGPNGELLDEYLSDGAPVDAPVNTWTVVVEAQDGTTGVVEVQFTRGMFLLSDDFCGGGIAPGQFIGEEMSPFAPTCLYYFDGQAGDVVTIRMTRQGGAANPLDTYLTLLDPNDRQEDFDDDGGLPPTNSLIREHTLLLTGEYTIVAGSFNEASKGPFYLAFWKRSP